MIGSRDGFIISFSCRIVRINFNLGRISFARHTTSFLLGDDAMHTTETIEARKEGGGAGAVGG